jgi:hypothetical protein
LNVNGIEVLTDVHLARFLLERVSLKDFEDGIRVMVNERGTLRLTLDNQGISIPANPRIQLAGFYTSDEHEKWLKSADLCPYTLGQKQQSFKLTIPDSTLAGTRTNLSFELPSQKGDVIGFSITPADTSTTTLIYDRYFDVFENGVEIIQNYVAALSVPMTARKYFQWYKLIPAASRINFVVENATDTVADEDYFITFYFGN